MDPEKLRELEGAWIQSPRDWRREWHFRLSGHVATYSPLRIPSAQEQGLLKGSKDLADKKPELLVLLHQGSEHCSLHHSQAAHMCESNSMGSNRLFWTPLALTHKCTFKYTNNFLISKKNKKKKKWDSSLLLTHLPQRHLRLAMLCTVPRVSLPVSFPRPPGFPLDQASAPYLPSPWPELLASFPNASHLLVWTLQVQSTSNLDSGHGFCCITHIMAHLQGQCLENRISWY